MENDSAAGNFILVGFSEHPQAEFILSLFVFGFYGVTLTGNTAIFLVSLLDSRLHTPMHFFLRNLSFLDVCFTTCIVPQMLANVWGDRRISAAGCVVQYSVALALGSTECVLLAVMAVDCYAAVMHQQVCRLLTAMSWLSGFANSLLQSSLAVVLPLCGRRLVDHFLCEVLVIIKLSCVDTRPTESKMLVARLLILAIPVCTILASYACVARAVLSMRSAEGRQKAWGTCASHLTVVSLFYGTITFMYLQPKGNHSQGQGKVLALVHTVTPP
ncbi:Olfactory receptor 2Y1 [Tupaia chinensis]|uniref:Olfactory receptor 2Y1 n=1 Tax=Tupaia chinensis TaxID=246437 RepID=L9KVA0_TUPCH|nr:Olfactory receptor 2Y1 [Tupaia chinensis]